MNNLLININHLLLSIEVSIDKFIGSQFAECHLIIPDTVGILFEMAIDLFILSSPFARINNITHYNTEHEILFSMHTIFLINQISQIDNNNRL
jgi:hypothetical protein